MQRFWFSLRIKTMMLNCQTAVQRIVRACVCVCMRVYFMYTIVVFETSFEMFICNSSITTVWFCSGFSNSIWWDKNGIILLLRTFKWMFYAALSTKPIKERPKCIFLYSFNRYSKFYENSTKYCLKKFHLKSPLTIQMTELPA